MDVDDKHQECEKFDEDPNKNPDVVNFIVFSKLNVFFWFWNIFCSDWKFQLKKV